MKDEDSEAWREAQRQASAEEAVHSGKLELDQVEARYSTEKEPGGETGNVKAASMPTLGGPPLPTDPDIQPTDQQPPPQGKDVLVQSISNVSEAKLPDDLRAGVDVSKLKDATGRWAEHVRHPASLIKGEDRSKL